jgi:hypothetical protein
MVCAQNRLLDEGEPFDYCMLQQDDNQYFNCLADNDCRHGYFCEKAVFSDEQRCYRARQAGEDCSPTQIMGGDRCDDTAYCADKVCIAKPVFGQPCDPAPCADGFVCVTAQLDGVCVDD